MALPQTCVNWKALAASYKAVLCWSLAHPLHAPSDTCLSYSKVAGKMPGVNGHTHHQLQLNDSWNGWKNKDRTVSLLPSSSGNSVALSQGREQRDWSAWRISAKRFKALWKLKRTYFYNSTFSIVNFSAKFLDRNDDFDCYISNKSKW